MAIWCATISIIILRHQGETVKQDLFNGLLLRKCPMFKFDILTLCSECENRPLWAAQFLFHSGLNLNCRKGLWKIILQFCSLMIWLLASFSHHQWTEYGCSKRKRASWSFLFLSKFLWFPSEHCIQPDVKKPIADAKKKAPLIYMPFVVVVKMGTGEIAYYSQWNPLDLQAPECILYRIWLLDLLFSVFFCKF